MSSTRLLVLGAVRIFQPVHGYDVRRELLSWRVDQWANVAPGSIYNALKSLTKEKYLKVAGTGQIGGRPERTQYSLTGEGEKEYQALLRATWWKVEPPLDAMMPALCFMPTLGVEELTAALQHRITTLEGALKQLEFSRKEIGPPETPEHVKELYDRMHAILSAEIPWARTLIGRLGRGTYEVGKGAAAAKPGAGHGRRPKSS
ncbi:MAG TPA: helix-turn-helix transcriptional regulator [Polyangia bacterium]|nr:helix-turn-helix transcriptional regulator [Polyangia bacterium]